MKTTLRLPERKLLIKTDGTAPQWSVNFTESEKQAIVEAVYGDPLAVRLCLIHSCADAFYDTDNHLVTQDIRIYRGVSRAREAAVVNLHPVVSKYEMGEAIRSAYLGGAKGTFKNLLVLKQYPLPRGVGPTNACSIQTIPEGRYVIKPGLGARSIGQIYFDTTKLSLIDLLNKFKKSWFYDKEEVPDGVFLTNEGEQEKDEGYRALGNKPFVQEFNDNCLREYRIILGRGGEIEFIAKRSCSFLGNSDIVVADKNPDKLLATGNKRGILDAVVSSVLPHQVGIENEFRTLVAELKLEYCSLDLFINKDGKWGIYEYSSEFSANDWPRSLYIGIMSKWYVQVIRNWATSATSGKPLSNSLNEETELCKDVEITQDTILSTI